jgi:hypothetical protein
LAVQVTEGDGYCLGRVLINAQIAVPVVGSCSQIKQDCAGLLTMPSSPSLQAWHTASPSMMQECERGN